MGTSTILYPRRRALAVTSGQNSNRRHGRPDCRALALIRRLKDKVDVGIAAFHLLQELARAVGRRVIDYEDFLGDRRFEHTSDHFLDLVALIVDRHDYGERTRGEVC